LYLLAFSGIAPQVATAAARAAPMAAANGVSHSATGRGDRNPRAVIRCARLTGRAAKRGDDGMTTKELLVAIADAERGAGPKDLDGAPVLTGWRLMLDGALLRAAGDLSGHPTISDPFVTTSPVLGFDLGAGWMRTRSRWYRLGEPDDRDHLVATEEAAQRLLAALRVGARRAFGGSRSAADPEPIGMT